MTEIRGYRELRVYQAAFESALKVYELTRRWPPEERYRVTNQILKSTQSVRANIAEAWRRRRYPGSFVSKLTDADAESAETEVWLDFAKAFRLPSEDEHAELSGEYGAICGQLQWMMSEPGKWCPRRAFRGS